jgi:hypothetical protein
LTFDRLVSFEIDAGETRARARSRRPTEKSERSIFYDSLGRSIISFLAPLETDFGQLLSLLAKKRHQLIPDI